MSLSAQLLDSFDRCERRSAFERQWEPKSISPLGLLYATLEHGLDKSDLEQSIKDQTIKIAKSREILTDQNSFMVVRHVGYLAAIIGVALRERLGMLTRVPPTAEWESNLWETASGERHRIVLVSHLDDDVIRSFAHGWSVIGELVALQAPLTLTAVVVGAHRGGRRYGAWSKGLLHPANHVLRFKRRQGNKGDGFTDSWLEVWREQRGEISTEKWLNSMREDGALDSLIVSRPIPFNPLDHRMKIAQRDMREIVGKIETAREDSPMRRSSCDEIGRGACPFQSVCWSPIETSPDRLVHLYRPISSSVE